MASRSQAPCIAIAGATGSLGKHITNTLLEPSIFSQLASLVILFRKKPEDSTELRRWAGKGAKIVVYNEDDLASDLEGVDVLVNSIGSGGDAFKDRLVQSLPQTEVRLYFPSEFGIDHTLHNFPHPTFDFKKRHLQLAKDLSTNSPKPFKTIRVFIGLFLEDLLPDMGFRFEDAHFEAVGSKDQKASYTSMDDVGRIITVLSTMSSDELANVPETVRFSGTSASMSEIAEMMTKAQQQRRGMQREIRTTSVPLPEYKQNIIEKNRTDQLRLSATYDYLRFLIGDGSIDYRNKSAGGLGNDNELMNPRQTKFKWKTMQQFASETNGRP